MKSETRGQLSVWIARLRLALAPLLGLAILLSGCTSMQIVPAPTAGEPQTVAVKVGEKVKVRTKTGETLTFRVTAIEADAFTGRDVRILYRDIAGLQVERLDKTRTAIAVVAAVVVIGGLAVVAGNMFTGISLTGA